MTTPKIIAFLLPQFHRVAENDQWWGEGFTEWTNVKKATAKYRGHRQPRRPMGDRYYDLTDPETRRWQAALAKEHEIFGFCYYHYWFKGKQLLEKPLNGVLAQGEPDFPFCIAWANEPWTRTWDGGDRHVLMPQEYGGRADWEEHYNYLEKMFKDPRYIKVAGCPMLLIYRTGGIEVCEEMLGLWRSLALKSGFPGLHVVSMLTFFGRDDRSELFDAYVAFEPGYTQSMPSKLVKAYERLVNGINRFGWAVVKAGVTAPRSRDYRLIWRAIVNRTLSANLYPGAFVDWDNSPRKALESSMVMRHAGVATFEKGFSRLYDKAKQACSSFVFINAWNEWAEGTYLEPDEHHGTAYLEAIKATVQKVNGKASTMPNKTPAR